MHAPDPRHPREFAQSRSRQWMRALTVRQGAAMHVAMTSTHTFRCLARSHERRLSVAARHSKGSESREFDRRPIVRAEVTIARSDRTRLGDWQ
jgi:hypothetical protein